MLLLGILIGIYFTIGIASMIYYAFGAVLGDDVCALICSPLYIVFWPIKIVIEHIRWNRD